MRFLFFLGSLLVLWPAGSKGQADTLRYSLHSIIELAAKNSAEVRLAGSRYSEHLLLMRYFNESLKPQFSLEGNLPNLSRAIQALPLPDGQERYINRSIMYNTIGLVGSYGMLSTGGRLSLESNIERLDVLKTSKIPYSRTYFFTPLSIVYTQPLFRFNELKWEKKHHEFLYKELKAEQAHAREEAIRLAVSRYSEAFLAQYQVHLYQAKIADTEELFTMKSRLLAIGKAEKAEVLRLDLDRQRNVLALKEARLSLEKALYELCDFLQIERTANLVLVPPSWDTLIPIAPEEAARMALENAYLTASFNRRTLERRSEIERAEKKDKVEVSFRASLGLNQTNDNLGQLFQNVQDAQTISLSVRMPLNKNELQEINQLLAREQANRESLLIEEEKKETARNALLSAKAYEVSKNKIEIAQSNIQVAEEIFQITRMQYARGEKSVIELNIARSELEQAELDYYRSILNTFSTYYEIRRFCLFDFATGATLVER